MTKSELNKLKDTLEKKQAELLKVIVNREGIEIEKSPDALDEVQHAAERELAIRNLDRDSALLRNVRAALVRCADGSYGVCMHCEEDISPKRRQRYRGPDTASPARKLPIAIRQWAKRALTTCSSLPNFSPSA